MTTSAPSIEAAASGIRTFDHREFPTERLLAAKGSTSVSVCLPARNEAATVGEIVSILRTELLERGVVDEIVVLDDHSTDATAAIARSAGARVADASMTLPSYGGGHGKGEVLWKSLLVADGEIIIWCDSDISEFGSRFVAGLLGPLLCEPDVEIAKGFYRRPELGGDGGGRVTELVARPLISLFFPELAALHQPLSGEYGGRREVLEQLPFFQGYGVDLGLLIDHAAHFGTAGLVQVDLDVRHHRNRTLSELGPQAMAIMKTILSRVDPDLAPVAAQLLHPDAEAVTVDVSERPPMIQVPDYVTRRRAVTHG